MSSQDGETRRAGHTRVAILAAAERLFAERGVMSVSNRQISDAAGQGNNTAVGYHFGTKHDLVRAIVRTHEEPIEHLRAAAIEAMSDPTQIREWAHCLVGPLTAHLASAGSPSWYARFLAQLIADPALHETIADEALSSASLVAIVDGFNRCLPQLSAEVHVERSIMARHLIVNMCAEHERALATRKATPRASWDAAATGLTDAIVGLYQAPVTALAPITKV
ncbi:TetR/AcrR family transcriptional regulator [Sciscionella marina]|uniref:TetR/AcrR family transcriptional regulator n=1 Tax=Sciscionella marina TaxID=508770 RepID=UPI00058D08C9|nr:TetR family transcriptional regulator [Sciscionella marina]